MPPHGISSWRIDRLLLPSTHHDRILKPRHPPALPDSARNVMLRQRGINVLVIAGVAGDVCVLAIAQDANMPGLRGRVPLDTMATRIRLRKHSTLALLQRLLKVSVRSSGSCTAPFPSQ